MFNKNDETAITVETIVVMMKHTHIQHTHKNTCKKEKNKRNANRFEHFQSEIRKMMKIEKKIENTFKTLQKKRVNK